MIRALHLVKTSDGAHWAANQVAILVREGIEVHVALPCADGRTMQQWRETGAVIHIADLSLPARQPARFPTVRRTLRRLVDEVQPDVIHSHFVTTTLMLRLALGRGHRIPRIFQVAGPLHLEHWHSRRADLSTAGPADYWIASSRCIQDHYLRAYVSPERLFLSYPGWKVEAFSGDRRFYLNQRLQLGREERLVGNINLMYPPKYFLGQRVGLKCHEDVIDAVAAVCARRRDVLGVLIGNSVGRAEWYERSLQKRATAKAAGRILLPGLFSLSDVAQSWPDFDCAVHVPMSENCGGVLEPLLSGVPVVASAVGGIPEVVIEGVTGVLVPPRSPGKLAAAVEDVLDNPARHRRMSATGRTLVKHMFDVERTGREVAQVYRRIVNGSSRPADFDSREFVRSLNSPGQSTSNSDSVEMVRGAAV
jgi:glycosyltransferase involved in cell wall biosynthesis